MTDTVSFRSTVPRVRRLVGGRKLAALATCILVLAATVAGCTSPRPKPGPRVVLGPRPDMFPESWRDPSIAAWAKPLPDGEEARSFALVERAMSKYSPQLLAENLESVHVVGELGFRGISAGGTNAQRRIYQANGSQRRDYTDAFVESTFHHEFSSILLRNHPELFPRAEWLDANPEGFRYGEGGVEAVKHGRHSVTFADEHNEQGFVCEYARSSLEEDFNTVAEALFMNTEEFWLRVDRFPKLARKVELAVSFYERLDPAFRRDHFQPFSHVSAVERTGFHVPAD